jgi:hypothetical protein
LWYHTSIELYLIVMKKITVIFILFIALQNHTKAQSVGIGTNTPHPSSLLELSESSKGLLIPRMTLAQRNAILNPAEGLMVYQTNDTIGFWYYSTGNWFSLINNQTQQNTDLKIKRVLTRQYLIQ